MRRKNENNNTKKSKCLRKKNFKFYLINLVLVTLRYDLQADPHHIVKRYKSDWEGGGYRAWYRVTKGGGEEAYGLCGYDKNGYKIIYYISRDKSSTPDEKFS